MFLERHLYSGALSWATLQYMIAEVQYGRRITDDMDRVLFTAYSDSWLNSPTLGQTFTFNFDTTVAPMPKEFVYSVPDATELEEYQRIIHWDISRRGFTGR